MTSQNQSMEIVGKPAELSKNEQKRRAKLAKKLKEKEEKAATVQEVTNKISEDDVIAYYESRQKRMIDLKAQGINPYPHKFKVEMSLKAFVDKYDKILRPSDIIDEVIAIAGRVYSIRDASQKLKFIDIRGEMTKIQVLANASKYGYDDKLSDEERLALFAKALNCMGIDLHTLCEFSLI